MQRRRGHGEGSIKKRRDGRWQGSFELEAINGSRRRRYVYGKTQAECADKLRDARDAQVRGFAYDSKTTVAQYMETWLQSRKSDLKASTWAAYSVYVEHYVDPFVGNVKLTALRTHHVDYMLRELEAKGYKPTTRRKARMALRQAMDHALRRRLIRENPVVATSAPTGDGPLKDHISQEEASKVLAMAGTDKYRRFSALVVLALTFGLRRGELLGLKWSDVDFVKQELAVRRTLTWVPVDGTVVTSTKTKAGRRKIPLVAGTDRALREHHERMEIDRAKAGDAWPDDAYVFATHVGAPLSPRNINRWWQKLTVEALGRTVRLHAARHTAAVLMLEQGVPLEVVSAILGHASLSITMDIYGDVGMDLKRRALLKALEDPDPANVVALPLPPDSRAAGE